MNEVMGNAHWLDDDAQPTRARVLVCSRGEQTHVGLCGTIVTAITLPRGWEVVQFDDGESCIARQIEESPDESEAPDEAGG